MITIPLFHKRLISGLAMAGVRVKKGLDTVAVFGILFRKKGCVLVCGCAFPKQLVDGCSASGAVSKYQMAHTIAKIYKSGYVPVGLVMISSQNEDRDCPYETAYEDRYQSFKYLERASDGFVLPLLLVVVDDNNILYYRFATEDNTMTKQEKVTREQLKNIKGGVVWISHDNLTSSILKGMGEKVLL